MMGSLFELTQAKMKKMKLQLFLTTTLFLISFQNSSGQDTIYLDRHFEETTKIKHHYYRLVNKAAKKVYKVKDYYKSGQLQMSGTFTSKRLKKKTGPFTYFHENGNKDAEGNFNKDKREGEWIWDHENGAKSSIEKFSKGKRKTANFFDVNGGEVSLEEAEQEPKYLGTDKEFLEYITSNVKYPD